MDSTERFWIPLGLGTAMRQNILLYNFLANLFEKKAEKNLWYSGKLERVPYSIVNIYMCSHESMQINEKHYYHLQWAFNPLFHFTSIIKIRTSDHCVLYLSWTCSHNLSNNYCRRCVFFVYSSMIVRKAATKYKGLKYFRNVYWLGFIFFMHAAVV